MDRTNRRWKKHQKSKLNKPKPPRRGWHEVVVSVKAWPMAMMREVRRIHWVSKSKLFQLFVTTISFILFFVLIFAAFDQLWQIILRSIHAL